MMDMKKECWNCKNNNQYAKFPCDYCHTGNIDDFWKPKDEMKDFAIEEIEKIKAEIDDFDIIEVSGPIKMGFNTMQRIALKVLDGHISELKGE